MKLEEEKTNYNDVIEKLQKAEDKSSAIVETINEIVELKYSKIIDELREEAERAEIDSEFAKKLKLRTLSKEEKSFYEKFKDIKQAITTNQIDAIPTTIIDVTMEDIKESNSIINDIVEFAPANVARWITASKNGTFIWGELTSKFINENDLKLTLKGLNVELGKLSTFLIIPKSIRDLELPYVDKYFRAVLKEVMEDGIVNGVLVGNGKNAPIGIYKKIDKSEDGENKDKDVATELTNFSPKGLAAAKKYLTNDGKRSIDRLILVCNPSDEADYVAPALYDAEGRLISSFKNLTVYTHSENPKGKAALLLPKKYTMGFSGLNIKEYDQTLAMDDADVIIAKVYGNGRAVDDNTAYVFDVTKLEEYVPSVKVVNISEASAPVI